MLFDVAAAKELYQHCCLNETDVLKNIFNYLYPDTGDSEIDDMIRKRVKGITSKRVLYNKLVDMEISPFENGKKANKHKQEHKYLNAGKKFYT